MPGTRRLEKPTYCEFARLRVAFVSPGNPGSSHDCESPARVRTIASLDQTRLFELGACMVRTIASILVLELALQNLGEGRRSHDCESLDPPPHKFLGIYPKRAHRCAKAPRKPCAPMSTKTKATTSDPRRSRIIYDRTLGSWSERSPGTGALLAT